MNNLYTEILIERHGQSLGNVAHVFLGHTDLDLSELGYRQAELCAEHFANEKIDAIYSSDLLRAYNTAAPHARIRNMNIVAMRELREMHVGEWENMSVEDIKAKYPYEYTELWKKKFASFDCVGAESAPHVANRIFNAILNIAKQNKGKKILVATHAAAIRAFFGKIYGYSENEASERLDFAANASISRVLYDGERLIPLSYSEDGYLSDIATYWKE